MVNSNWKVIAEYDPQKEYLAKITPKTSRTLQMFKLDDVFAPIDFVNKHKDDKNWLKIKNSKNAKNTLFLALNTAQKLGIVKRVNSENQKTNFDEFIGISEINDFLKNIPAMNLKNTKQTKYQGTRGRYAHTVWKFNDWLMGKEFEFEQEFQVDESVFRRELKKIELTGLIHFLKLLENAHGNTLQFNQIIKKYLRDSIHDRKRSGAMRNTVNVIRSFFVFYDVALTFSFNHKAGHKTSDGDDEKKLMTLDDLFKLLTVGNPSIQEKALFLSKFHRGLDNMTFSDRFNYQVFEQLVNYFGSKDHNSWDLDMCPVPIDLVRVKTSFKHRGFLDMDAIAAIQDALDDRKINTGEFMKIGYPMFLNKYGNAISDGWIYDHFCTLADTAKLRHLREGYTNSYNVDAHESRDVLKTVAKSCKVDEACRDHFIGHMPKDSYEKETELYPETLRTEFMKMSSKINIFTKFSNLVNGTDDSDSLKIELSEILNKLNQKESEEKSRESALQRHELVLKQHQEKADENKRALQQLQEQISQMSQPDSKSTEFCCVNCSIIHDRNQCPNCGSKVRRIYDSNITHE